MNKILTGALVAATLGGVVLGGASTASAREWRHGGNGGAAVAAGIAGLAIGAALASNNHGYYGGGYYDGGYYAPARGYGYGYGYRHCRLESRWNYRWGGYEQVRVCY